MKQPKNDIVVIPQKYYLLPGLNAAEVALLGKIKMLCDNKEQACYAANSYFMEFFNFSKSSLTRHMRNLKIKGYTQHGANKKFDSSDRQITIDTKMIIQSIHNKLSDINVDDEEKENVVIIPQEYYQLTDLNKMDIALLCKIKMLCNGRQKICSVGNHFLMQFFNFSKAVLNQHLRKLITKRYIKKKISKNNFGNRTRKITVNEDKIKKNLNNIHKSPMDNSLPPMVNSLPPMVNSLPSMVNSLPPMVTSLPEHNASDHTPYSFALYRQKKTKDNKKSQQKTKNAYARSRERSDNDSSANDGELIVVDLNEVTDFFVCDDLMSRLRDISMQEATAKNLIKKYGKHNIELAFEALSEAKAHKVIHQPAGYLVRILQSMSSSDKSHQRSEASEQEHKVLKDKEASWQEIDKMWQQNAHQLEKLKATDKKGALTLATKMKNMMESLGTSYPYRTLSELVCGYSQTAVGLHHYLVTIVEAISETF